jgi:hypothetical protein
MATHAQVRHLYLKLVDVLGEEAAETLMELLRTGHDHHRDAPEDLGDLRSPSAGATSWRR